MTHNRCLHDGPYMVNGLDKDERLCTLCFSTYYVVKDVRDIPEKARLPGKAKVGVLPMAPFSRTLPL